MPRIVNKIRLAKSPSGSSTRSHALGNDGGNSGFMTRKNFFAFEIPPVCNRSEVAIDTGFNRLHAPLQLGAGEVAVTVIDCLELAAVDGDQCFREQTELLTQHHELTTDTADGFAVVCDKLAMVLKSGIRRPVSHISSTFRCASRSRRRLD